MLSAEMMTEAESDKWILIGTTTFFVLTKTDVIYRFFKRPIKRAIDKRNKV